MTAQPQWLRGFLLFFSADFSGISHTAVIQWVGMKRTVTTRYSVFVQRKQLAVGTVRLAYLTDLHSCCDPDEAARIRAALEAEQPDGLLFGGDMIVGVPRGRDEETIRFLSELAKTYPSWHAIGNHEYRLRLYPETYGDRYERYLAGLREAGIYSLFENASDLPVLNGVPLQFIGFDMERSYYRRFRKTKLPLASLRQATGEIAKDRVSILLAHDPSQADVYLDCGADLTLCGHYHGGIVRFGKHRGLISPNLFPFTGLAYGRFDRQGRSLIVSSGVGEHGIHLRVNNPREVVILDIKTEQEEMTDGN